MPTHATNPSPPAWLITGGMGFIGTALARRVLASGASVALFDNLHPQVHDAHVAAPPAGASLFIGDVADPGSVGRCVAEVRPDVVVHLAAETGTGQSLTEPVRHTVVNGVGTATLVEALRRAEHVPRRILLASSRAIYGEGRWQAAGGRTFYPAPRSAAALAAGAFSVLDEGGSDAVFLPHHAPDTHPNPSSVYAATKLLQEQVLRSYADATSAGLTVLRLQNVYGFGQAPNNPYTGIVMFFLNRGKRGLPIEVYEDGAIIRDFVHVSDVVDALAAAVSQDVDGTFDIGSGTQTTVLSLAQVISELLSSPPPVITGAFRAGDVRAAAADISAARAAFGYHPKVSLQDGLRDLFERAPA